jgi:sulfur relay (sulfurtransferase) DsrF/TusC family protein
MPKILNIIECAYRATIEEQDDTVLWFTHMMVAKGGAEMVVLLRGNAVNYLNKKQQVDKLKFGEAELGNPPKLAEDLASMMKDKILFYYVEEDAAERGLEKSDFISGAQAISRAGLAKFVTPFDRVFHW